MIQKFRLLFLASSAWLIFAQMPVPQSVPNGLPDWAYNIPDKVQPPAPSAGEPIRVPGSTREYSAAQTASNSAPPDWFPNEHGPAPPIVSGEGGVTMYACGSCHLMSGQGHPESADLAGLPAAYIIRQMNYFKSGARRDDARMGPISQTVSDEDVRQAAAYFASTKPIPFVRVLETNSPPKTYISTAGRHRFVSPEGGTEPIGRRIIETPEDAFRMANRDPHSGFVAYVPPGSVGNGEALVKAGGSGKTIQCANCHGRGLKGRGDVPRIAGMQPVYIARQLISMQNGSSAGAAAAPMKDVVAKLTEDDIIAISAYLGALPPK